MTSVCVIGAGIVGCATAWQLALEGHAVTLVDAAPGPGTATSFANGAQLSYRYVEPFASPATLRSLPQLLFEDDSPVRFRLHADPAQWRWGLRFLRACTATRVREGTARLLELARDSRRTLDAWMAAERWDVGFARHGKLVLCPDAASLAHQARQVAFQATLGCEQDVLTAAACRAIEPALDAARAPFVGGVWTADECVVDPHRLCLALATSLRAHGATLRFGTRVASFERRGDRIVAARTADGEAIAADAFVLAAGPQAAALARHVGLSLPIYPIRGYSLTLPWRGDGPRPRASVTHLGHKTVYAPLGDRLRVAAMAEIDGDSLAIPPGRVATMRRHVEAMYPGRCDVHDDTPWAGLRPATPDSLPIVARAGRGARNLVVNAGHGALGLTLAAGCALRAAAAVADALR